MSTLNTSSASRRIATAVAAILSAAAALAPLAPVRAADADETQNLGTIVVTAQKREQTELEVPASVTALSTGALTSGGLYRLEDFAAQVPGLSLTSLKPGENQVTIRGITTGLSQSAPATGIYIDEAPIGSVNAYTVGSQLVPDIDPAALSRVEVLKGPQGTLYGAGAMGGMLRYVTAGPDYQNVTGSFTLGGNTVDHGGNGALGRAYLNLPLGNNSMALQLSGFDRDEAGFIDDLNGRKNVNQAHTAGGRAAFSWRIDEDWRVTASALTHRVTDSDSQTMDVTLPTLKPLYGDLVQNVVIPQPTRASLNLYNVTVHGKLGTFDLVSSTTYQTVGSRATGDVTQSYGALLGQTFGIPDFGASLTQETSTQRWTEELRLDAHAFDDKLLYEVGGYFTRETDVNKIPGIDTFSSVTLTPIVLPFYIVKAEIDSTYREFSGFANATYAFTPDFSLQAGVRYSEDHQSYSQNYSGALVAGGPLIVNDAKESGNKTTYLGTASYKLSKDDALYARVATGYRAGGPNAPAPTACDAPLTFKPDSLTSYELGYKSVMAEGKASLEAAVYQTNWKDIQIQTSCAGFNFFVNGGTATSRGAEASFLVYPIANLSIRATVAYTDAYLTADAPAAGGQDGNLLPFVPQTTASLSSGYHWPVGGGWTADIGGSVDYTGARRSDYALRDSVSIRSFTTVNLSAGIGADHWHFSLYGKNFNDSRGIIYLATRTLFQGPVNPLAADGVNPYAAGVIQPRTFGVDVTYRF